MLSDEPTISLAHILVVCLVSNEKRKDDRNIFGGELSYDQEEDRNTTFEIMTLRTSISFHSLNIQSNSKC